MNQIPTSLDVEALLAHTDWVRALARTLLHDRSSADDVVQEAHLRALIAPPVRVVRLKSWLGTVVENLVRSEHRSRVRRERREQLAARPESLPSTQEIVEHEAARRRVVAAVLALAEPYRSTVLLRFWYGLAPTGIAEHLGVPAATVRTRLKRALAQLALELEHEHGGDERACAITLSSAAGGELAIGAAAAGTGAILLATKLAVAAALVLTGAVWVASSRDATPALESMPAPLATAASIRTAVPQPVLATIAPEPARQPLSVTTPAARGPAVAAQDLARVRGRCVADESGAPLAGCAVQLRGRRGGGGTQADGQPPRPDPVVTDAEGRFEIGVAAWSDPVDLEITRADRAPRRARWESLDAGQTEDLGEVRLARGFPVRGRVADEDGKPLRDVNLMLGGLPLAIDTGIGTGSSLSARSDASGAFAFAVAIPSGMWPLEATRRGHALVAPHRITVADPEGCAYVEVVMKAQRSIAGLVVDAQGTPVRGARIVVKARQEDSASTGADGRFAIFASEEAPEVVQLETGFGGAFEPLADERSFVWGTCDILLVVKRTLSLDLTVLEEGSKRPIEEFAIRYRTPDLDDAQVSPRLEGRHEGGRLVVDGIRRGRSFLRVIPADATIAISDEIAIDAADSGVAPLTVSLSRLLPLEVRVLAGVEPVAGSKLDLLRGRGEPVELFGDELDLRRRYNHRREPPLPLLISSATTGADGSATLHGPAHTGDLALRVLGPGHVPVLRAGIDLPLAETPLEIEVVRGCAVRGKLTGEGWRACHATEILLGIDDGVQPRAVKSEIAPDGSFAAVGLRPGTYRLHLIFQIPTPIAGGHGWNGISVPLGSAAVAADRDGVIELDTTPLVPGSLRLRLALEPDLLARASVGLFGQAAGLVAPEGEGSLVPGWGLGYYAVSASGEVEADGLPPGSCTVTVMLSSANGKFDSKGPFIECPRTLAIRPGATNSEVIDLPHKRLRVRVLSPEGAPLASARCEISAPADFLWKAEATTDADGWIVLDPASLAPVIVSVPGQGTSRPVCVPAGETEAEVEVELERKD